MPQTPLDEDRLRRALHLIADQTPAAPDANRPTRRWRVAAMVAAAVLVVAGGAYATTRAMQDDAPQAGVSEEADQGPGRGQSGPEWIACARYIAIGSVLDVSDGAQKDRLDVTFAVSEWIKPGEGPQTIHLDVVDPRIAQVRPPWEVGGPTLIVVPVNAATEADAFTGSDLDYFRGLVDRFLPAGQTATCPPEFAGD